MIQTATEAIASIPDSVSSPWVVVVHHGVHHCIYDIYNGYWISVSKDCKQGHHAGKPK